MKPWKIPSLVLVAILVLGSTVAIADDFDRYSLEVWSFEATPGEIEEAGVPVLTSPNSASLTVRSSLPVVPWTEAISKMPSYREVVREELIFDQDGSAEVDDTEDLEFASSYDAEGMPKEWETKEIGTRIRATLENAKKSNGIEVDLRYRHSVLEGWVDYLSETKQEKEDSWKARVPVISSQGRETSFTTYPNERIILGGMTREEIAVLEDGSEKTEKLTSVLAFVLRDRERTESKNASSTVSPITRSLSLQPDSQTIDSKTDVFRSSRTSLDPFSEIFTDTDVSNSSETANPEDSEIPLYTVEVWSFEASGADLIAAGAPEMNVPASIRSPTLFQTPTLISPGAIVSQGNQHSDSAWIDRIAGFPSYKEIYRTELFPVGTKTAEVDDQVAFKYPSELDANGKPTKWDERGVGLLARATVEEPARNGKVPIKIFAEFVTFEGWVDRNRSFPVLVSTEPEIPEIDPKVIKEIFGPDAKVSSKPDKSLNKVPFAPVFSPRTVDTEISMLPGEKALLGGLTRSETKEHNDGSVTHVDTGSFTVVYLRERVSE